MQITPRYGDPGLVTFDPPVDDPSVPALRQRRRLGALLADLDDRQWATKSRCQAWSVRDVIAHLVTTNRFWAYSIASGLAGEPTRILTGFDPVATPAALVDAMSAQSPAELLAQFDESNEALATAIGQPDAASWSAIAEAPPGHLAVSAVVLHALWDSWVHERDIVLPLGMDPALEEDELTCCLLYACRPRADLSRRPGIDPDRRVRRRGHRFRPPLRRRGRPRGDRPDRAGPGRDHRVGRHRRGPHRGVELPGRTGRGAQPRTAGCWRGSRCSMPVAEI